VCVCVYTHTHPHTPQIYSYHSKVTDQDLSQPGNMSLSVPKYMVAGLTPLISRVLSLYFRYNVTKVLKKNSAGSGARWRPTHSISRSGRASSHTTRQDTPTPTNQIWDTPVWTDSIWRGLDEYFSFWSHRDLVLIHTRQCKRVQAGWIVCTHDFAYSIMGTYLLYVFDDFWFVIDGSFSVGHQFFLGQTVHGRGKGVHSYQLQTTTCSGARCFHTSNTLDQVVK